ncbi:MAG: hypothetical protein IJR68_11725 [Fretibacterium sp.]|nr:hypothetical protein [Fretibacterium sp.]
MAAESEKLAVSKARLALYYKAEKAILNGQSYEIEGLKLTRADLGKVQDMIATLENKVERLSAKPRPRRRVIVPVDGWGSIPNGR